MDRLLKHFELTDRDADKPHLHGVKGDYYGMAMTIANSIPEGPERTVALRKLLESREAAIRAVEHPGG